MAIRLPTSGGVNNASPFPPLKKTHENPGRQVIEIRSRWMPPGGKEEARRKERQALFRILDTDSSGALDAKDGPGTRPVHVRRPFWTRFWKAPKTDGVWFRVGFVWDENLGTP